MKLPEGGWKSADVAVGGVGRGGGEVGPAGIARIAIVKYRSAYNEFVVKRRIGDLIWNRNRNEVKLNEVPDSKNRNKEKAFLVAEALFSSRVQLSGC